MVDYIIRDAAISDYDAIYALKSASVRPYVERIWGWDENYQRKDFEEDFVAISQFRVVEAEGAFAGFLQLSINDECLSVVEIHLLPCQQGRFSVTHTADRTAYRHPSRHDSENEMLSAETVPVNPPLTNDIRGIALACCEAVCQMLRSEIL